MGGFKTSPKDKRQKTEDKAVSKPMVLVLKNKAFQPNWPFGQFSILSAMSIFVFVCLSVCPYHCKTPTFCGQKLIFASENTFKKSISMIFLLLFLKTQNRPKSKLTKSSNCFLLLWSSCQISAHCHIFCLFNIFLVFLLNQLTVRLNCTLLEG